jgi:class 3 adenylate cyclase
LEAVFACVSAVRAACDEATLAVPLRKLAGHEDQIAGLHERDVVRARGGGLGQLKIEFGEPVVYLCGHVT